MSLLDRIIRAKKAAAGIGAAKGAEKNRALLAIRDGLLADRDKIFTANNRDLSAALENEVPTPLIKRLKFDDSKLQEVLTGIDVLASMEDPIGCTISSRELDANLELFQVTCAIGVVGVIFESRPDALVQISCLCLKSGNSVILKGGAEAAETNRALITTIARAAERTAIPDGWIQLAETREDVREMLALDGQIDLLVPRGSNEFVRYIMDNTNIPVLGHADGICHVYIHDDADVEQAVAVTVDSNTQYVAVCNAVETLLVHEYIAKTFLPKIKRSLESKGVTLRGCDRSLKIIAIEAATDEDWSTEYLDLVLSIKVVDSIEEAIRHINTYGSRHTDAIVTRNRQTAEEFMAYVDSANVFWNCSTRFADGYRYGLGAEVGISTSKIHARGPVGLEGLLTYKWKLFGDGQIAADYVGPEGKSFTHKPISGS